MQSRATRVRVLRTAALMILKLVNPLESLEDRITIHMNRLRTSLVFSSSSLKQRSMASPPLLRVPGGGVYLGP